LSNIIKRTYQLSIYLPPAYETESSKRFPSVYFQDGSEYQSLGSAVNIIDNLIDSSKIEQVIAVFVRPNDRNDEYAYNNRHNYRQFFVRELVPFIDSLYRTINKADKRLVLGDSFGGNISALISLYHPDVFGNCGQQSGAFWPNSYEASTLLFKGEYKNIKIHSVWGSYEGELTSDWRMGIDSLKAKGYKFSAKERPEGHSWGLWRANLDDMLIYFFPNNSSSVIIDNISSPSSFHLRQNYPNPFNPETIISYSLAEDSHVDLSVYDLLGNEISKLVNSRQTAGSYNVRFSAAGLSSGIYIYRLKTDLECFTRKMALIR
ncbi:MAG: alpha/beta hydrolase-fold protein, partial [Syntrophothermus sp.]